MILLLLSEFVFVQRSDHDSRDDNVIYLEEVASVNLVNQNHLIMVQCTNTQPFFNASDPIQFQWIQKNIKKTLC